jgi:splicing factor 3A subunit 2
MDRQNRPGAKTGSGGPASYEDANMERREWQRKVAMETIDLSKDPYFLKNHLGSYECRLCLTLHMNEGSYLAHTQGKKHQTNLARRAAREAKETVVMPQPKIRHTNKRIVKIGRPGYKVIKQRDPENLQKSLYFEIDFAEIDPDFIPKHRIMSAFEQKLEVPDKIYQYLLFAADPYETIAFKIPNKEIDKEVSKFYQYWDKEKKIYTLQLCFKERNAGTQKNVAPLPQKPSQFNPIGARF